MQFVILFSNSIAEFGINKIRQKTQLLKKHIEAGRKVPEFNDDNLRELIQGNYRIVYYIKQTDLIIIVAIVHSAKDMSNIELI